MKKIFLFLLPVLVLASCNVFDNYGNKITSGKSEVYYKGDHVTKEQAQGLADFLKESGYFDDETGRSVQLTKDEDDYIVHFVVDQKKITDDARLNWWKFQDDISKNVFDGKSVRVALADEKLKDLEVLDPIALYKSGKSTLYYDNAEVKKGEAKKVADFLSELKLFGDEQESDVFYQKEDGVPVIRLVVNPKKITDEILPAFSYYQEQMKETVFDGKKVKLILTSTKYEDMDPLPKLTDEQRQAFENELHPTENGNTENALDSTATQTTTSGVLRLPNN